MKRNQKTASDRVQKEKFQRNNQFPALLPKNENQAQMLEALKYSTVVVAQGSAGTGKTYLACYHASKKLYYKDIDKIILIRAYQPLAGRTIGFIPGSADEKLMPYYQQMIDYLEDFMGKSTVEIHLKNKSIEICSLETIRGRSWSKSIVIIDESQSLFVPEIQALTTRLGDDSQMILCGDNSGLQSDVRTGMDGLTYLEKITQRYEIPDVEFITFTPEDICRSGITKSFVLAFDKEQKLGNSLDSIVSTTEVNSQFKKGR